MSGLRLGVTRGSAEHVIDIGDGARIGSGTNVEVRIPDDAIAAVACTLEHDARGWSLRALADGVSLDGKSLRRGERMPFALGATIALAASPPVTIAVRAAPGDAQPSVERTASLARDLVRELLAGPGGPELVVETGPVAGTRCKLPPPGERVVVGRGDTATWILLDADLSREHVAFDRTWDGVRVVDLGSKNGTRVGGALAPTTAPGKLVADGELIELGGTSIRFLDPAEQYLRELDRRLAAPAPRRWTGDADASGTRWPAIVAGVIAVAAIAALILLFAT
ncbi:MAG: FHA domain-containing protein [Deltaproteobacteria bacterium]|nr:FHA domain-containing protein [Deltaproteobacteria bacterium]